MADFTSRYIDTVIEVNNLNTIEDILNYDVIEGKWLNDEPYGTIHRIASNGTEKGIMKICLDYCDNYVSNIRIDTHKDNKIMQHLLEKFNFKYCGIIYLSDGNPRLAYHRIKLH